MMGTEVTVDEGGSEVTVNTSAPAVVEVQTETVVTIEVLVAGPQGPPGDPATNLVTSVNTQQGDVVLDAHDVGALPATQITGGHAVDGSVAFAEVVITSTGDLDDPDLGTPRIVVDNTSLQHVVVTSGDYDYTSQCVSNAYGVEVSYTNEYGDGTSYSLYARISRDAVTVGGITFDDAGQPSVGSRSRINDQAFVFESISPDGVRTLQLLASSVGALEPDTARNLFLPAKDGTLATVDDTFAAVNAVWDQLLIGSNDENAVFTTYRDVRVAFTDSDAITINGDTIAFDRPAILGGHVQHLRATNQAIPADTTVLLPPRSGTLALRAEDNTWAAETAAPAPTLHEPLCATTPVSGEVRVTLAKANVNAHGAAVLGLVTGEAGSVVTYTTLGPVENPAWSWTPLQPIYLGNGGVLTQTPPDSSTCAFLLQVGVALSPTTMLVRIGEPIYFGVADLPDV